MYLIQITIPLYFIYSCLHKTGFAIPTSRETMAGQTYGSGSDFESLRPGDVVTLVNLLYRK